MSLCECTLDAEGKIKAICWGCLQHRLDRLGGRLENGLLEFSGEPAEILIHECLELLHLSRKEVDCAI